MNFQNEWTQNHILFTQYGNPRNVKFTIASFRHKHQCFVDIGYWYCEVDADNETCTGSLTLTNELEAVDTFLGVCGPPCTPGQHKILDKNYPSCCWKCGNCTHNKYSTKPGSSTCQSCGQDQWPTDNHTACVTVKPEMFLLTKDPTGIILLCVNVISIVVLIAFTVLMVKYSQSKMKIFSGRLLCYLLLFGILMCNTVSIFVLMDAHKDSCVLVIILARIGSTCTLGTIFVKTNDVYKTYKKKIFKGRYNYCIFN